MSSGSRATAKIINPDWPTDYIIIAQADFDPERDQLWPADMEATPRGAVLVAPPVAPPLPVVEGPPAPVDVPAVGAPAPEPASAPAAAVPEPVAAPEPAAAPEPEPAPEEPVTPPPSRVETLARQRIVDLGPWIAACGDAELLRELVAVDSRATIRRLITSRLHELER